jgi:hypothetical protein
MFGLCEFAESSFKQQVIEEKLENLWQNLAEKMGRVSCCWTIRRIDPGAEGKHEHPIRKERNH